MAEKKNPTTVTISVKFPVGDAKQLKKDAKKKKVTTSAVIKKCVKDAYTKETHEMMETSIAEKMVHLQQYFNTMEMELKKTFPDGTIPETLMAEMNKTKKEMIKLWQI